MNNTCPNPGCGAEYDLTSQPIGSQFNCQQCGKPLSVEADGLHLTATPPLRSPDAASGKSSQIWTNANQTAKQVLQRMNQLTDVSTWLFGIGTFLGLCALFFPLIDQAKVSRLEAMLVAGDMRQQRITAHAQREEATPAEKTQAEESKKKAQVVKSGLEENVESSELSRRSWTWVYRYLTLFSFTLLVLGAFGYLDERQPTMRRVLGCIVLAAIVLVILNALARTSFRLEIGPGI